MLSGQACNSHPDSGRRMGILKAGDRKTTATSVETEKCGMAGIVVQLEADTGRPQQPLETSKTLDAIDSTPCLGSCVSLRQAATAQSVCIVQKKSMSSG